MIKDSTILVYVKFAGFELRLRYLASFLKNDDAERGEESQASPRTWRQGSQVGFIKWKMWSRGANGPFYCVHKSLTNNAPSSTWIVAALPNMGCAMIWIRIPVWLVVLITIDDFMISASSWREILWGSMWHLRLFILKMSLNFSEKAGACQEIIFYKNQ